MYEMITLKCRCGDYILKAGNDLDIAEFLRYAVAGGWRRINEQPVKAIESDGVTEIVLSGTCAKCEPRNNALAKSIFGNRVLSQIGKLFVRAE
jgi:hypothetical protein